MTEIKLQWSAKDGPLLYGSDKHQPSIARTAGAPTIEVHQLTPFNGTSLGWAQDSPNAKAAVARYYFSMLRLLRDRRNHDAKVETGEAAADSVEYVGILTQLHPPHAVGDERRAPWEFFSVDVG